MPTKAEMNSLTKSELWDARSEELRQIAAKALELSILTHGTLDDRVAEINRQRADLLGKRAQVFAKELLLAPQQLGSTPYTRVVCSDSDTIFGITGTYRGIASIDVNQLDVALLPLYAQKELVVSGLWLKNASLSETKHLGNVIVPFSAMDGPVTFEERD
ncbi:MAG TPA: hypothetical protein VLG13_00420 [Patescibacteria group bacterium]|nr:hypothetical protein [Patescibacteria group bacterium]